MLKKMLLLLMAAMLLVVPVSVAAEDVALTATEGTTSELTYEQKVLLGLDLITTNSYGEIDLVGNVTREDFAGLIGKLIDVDPTYSADKTYYVDVEPNMWSTHTINKLAEMGVLTIPADRMFRPKDNITFNEAVKMFVCILGYGDVAAQGGFPNGYLSIANQIDLLDGVDKTSKYLTNGALADLMYNALHIEILNVQGVNQYVEYSSEEKETILSKYHNIYIVEGIIETVHGLTITDEDVAPGYCIIEGITFADGGIKVEQMLGYSVTAYYEKSNEKRELVYIDASETISMTILSDASPVYASGVITYYGENDKLMKAKITDDASFISNGEAIYSDIDKALDVENGEIRLIDRDDDGVYDVVFVEDYETVIVKSVNTTNAIVVNTLDESVPLDLSDETRKQVWIYDVNGNSLDITGITIGAVLDVAVSDSGNCVIVRITQNTIAGTVDSIQLDEQIVVIDGEEYTYYQEAKDKCFFTSGKSGEFKLNRYGKVAYFTEGSISGNPGYLIDVAQGQGMDPTVKLRLMKDDGKVYIVNTVSKVKIDGATSVDPFYDLSQNLGHMIIYRTNGNGEITYVDTIAKSANEDDATLQLVAITSAGGADRLSHTAKKFGKKYMLSDDVLLFGVNLNKESPDTAFKMVELADLKDNRAYDTKLYKTGLSSQINLVAVVDSTACKLADEDPFLWCVNVRDAVNAAGEPVTQIEAYQGKALVILEVVEGYDPKYIPKRGDIFRAAVDASGKTLGIEIHYDYATNGMSCNMDPAIANSYSSYAHRIRNYWNVLTDLYYLNRMVIGHAIEVDGNLVSWGIQRENLIPKGVTKEEIEADPDKDPINETYEVDENGRVDSNCVVIVYDAAEDRFYEGSVGDIMPAKTYGANGASELIGRTTYGGLKVLHVINNRDYGIEE